MLQVESNTKSAIDGLWVLLVSNHGQLSNADEQDRVPVMARAGDDETFLLGFKNMSKARSFIQTTALDGAEPRMVVKSNNTQYVQIARAAGAAGVLVDYDPSTQQYAAATELF